MFVKENSVTACLSYMKERLTPLYSDGEIRMIQALSFEKRLGFSRSDLMLKKDTGLSESDLLFFHTIVKRLVANEPFQYIMGETEFCDLILKIDKRALIPRPETSELVFNLVNEINHYDSSDLKIIDVCTGSGCIALAIKNSVPQASVTGVDIDLDALELAKENGHFTQLSVDFRHLDVLNWREADWIKNEKWNIIVSNPPYIPNRDKEEMSENVLKHEPHIALFVDDTDPLLFYREIASFSAAHLSENGILAVEIHENLAQETCDVFHSFGFKNTIIIKDMQEKERMVFARKN
jgi:release factor glutamine methyltransferase